jgi:soluble lytic murein transglycosylase-like protein
MKHYNTLLILAFIVIIASFSAHASINLINEKSAEWPGTEAIRNGNFKKALTEIISDSAVSDSAFHFFKLGCVHQGLKSYSKAIFFFRMSAKISKQYLPFAYEKIGDIELGQKRYNSALKAFRVAAGKATLSPYRYYLSTKMYSIAIKHKDAVGEIAWLEEMVGEDKTITQSSIKDILSLMVSKGKIKDLDSIVLYYLDTLKHHKAQCQISSFLKENAVDDKVISTKTLYLLSKVSYTCRDYKTSSDWLHKALERKDFSKTIPKGQYIYHRAILNYRLRNYGNMIKWAKKYEKISILNPTLVYMMARSYRSMGKGSKAAYWYDKHIEMFPAHKRTHDIIWYRAWQKEDAGKFVEARAFYKRIFERHSRRSKADDAYFRYTLTYCKEKEYDSAKEAFTDFLNRYPYSSLAKGAHYWKAKCFYYLKKRKSARIECEKIIEAAPTSYYAFRARELLVVLGQEIKANAIDTIRTSEETETWLDSLGENGKKLFSQEDSATFYFGSCLAAVGLVSNAELVLERFELAYIKNLQLKYKLAHLYKKYNAPTRSYKVARQLYSRIPRSARSYLPVGIYSLLYPDSFSDYIKAAAKTNNIKPELISSIIRQESIFDPKIVSPVGAIGLMQIMPYTGEEIANDLKEEFILDSLYEPACNVRYGSYYIKKLIDKFNGDYILAIAGYNGGPHNAKKWKAQNKDDDFDMFIEDIGFTETRKYVKKVLGNYWTYKLLKSFGTYYLY